MISDSELNNLPPEKRREAIQAYLKGRGIHALPDAITPESILARQATGIWDQVLRNVAKPLLKAIPNPQAYNPAGTQRLLCDAFKTRFNGMSKDELVMLVSIMHAEELEKQIVQMVNAGMVGPDLNKPL